MYLHLQAWVLAILVGLAVVALIGSIIIILLIIFILRRIQRIARRADDLTESLPDLLRMIGKRFGPMAITTIVGAVLNRIRRKTKSSD